MMKNLFLAVSNSGWNGAKSIGEATGKPNLLILICVLFCLATIGPLLIVSYNLVKFKKSDMEVKHTSALLVSILFIFLGLSLISNILSIVFYYGASIFPNSLSQAETMVYIFIALSIVFAAINYVVLLFFNQYFALGISKDTFYVFGEAYPSDKIINIVKDEEKKLLSVHFTIGKRVVKRIKFGYLSMAAQTIEENVDILGKEIIKGNDKDIYTKQVEEKRLAYQNELLKKSSAQQSNTSKAEGKKDSEEAK